MNNTQPNVMFIMADQLRYDVLDNEQVITPNLDELREQALTMEEFYSNTPVCVPSRCCIATGRYPHSTRVRENHTVLEANREIHIFRAMKQAGYSIGYSGKNHLLEKEEFENFDYAVFEENRNETDQEKALHAFMRERSKEVGGYGYKCASYHEFGIESTSAHSFTSKMIEYIEKHIENESRPFFNFLSIVEPHYPHVVPKEIWDMYEGVEFKVPEVMDGDIEKKASRFVVKQRAQHADAATYEDKQNYLRAYYSFVTLFDMQVGRIVDALKEKGLFDNTLLMVTSDHGEFAFNHNMYKKDLVLQEDLLHIPMIVSLPKTVCGDKTQLPVRINGLAEQVDIMPTILDVCGIELPFGIQGKSMLPVLMGNLQQGTYHKEAVFSEINPPWLRNPFATYEDHLKYWEEKGVDKKSAPFNVPGDYCKSIRTNEYRYVWYGTGEEELYDLEEDPNCCNNVLAEEGLRYAEIARELKIRLLEWNALTEDPIDPVLLARLQEKYCCWKNHDAGNHGSWLPYWVEMNTPFSNR